MKQLLISYLQAFRHFLCRNWRIEREANKAALRIWSCSKVHGHEAAVLIFKNKPKHMGNYQHYCEEMQLGWSQGPKWNKSFAFLLAVMSNLRRKAKRFSIVWLVKLVQVRPCVIVQVFHGYLLSLIGERPGFEYLVLFRLGPHLNDHNKIERLWIFKSKYWLFSIGCFEDKSPDFLLRKE